MKRLDFRGCLQFLVLSCVLLFAVPRTVAHQAPLSMEFSRQERWRRLPFPTLGDLPDPGIELVCPVAPALAGGFFSTVPPRKSYSTQTLFKLFYD